MKFLLKIIFHFVIFVLLTALTQIGGLIYLVSILIIKSKTEKRRLKKISIFISLYLISTFFIVPNLAPIFGREKIKESNFIVANTIFTKLLNRNYVRADLNNALEQIALGLDKKHKGIKLMYLDANFPFIDKFPLLPHLSHNDGKKIDISLIYEDENENLTNKKPSISGYGVFENPKKGEYKQLEVCQKKGYWQYDFPKYLTFGSLNKNIQFSERATKNLVLEVLKQPEIGKIFIEPHLKSRMNLTNYKIRFHGCQAVRHDDHIHIQLK